jgi:hypothetical protein
MGKAGKPLTQNKLARMLKPLGIAPAYIGPEDERQRGYKLASFEEVFARYLPSEGVSNCASVQSAVNTGTSDNSKVCSQDDGCTVAKCEKPNNDGPLHRCTVAKEDTVASVPFMLTRDLKRRLRVCGYSDEQIAHMTPQEAHDILGQLAQQPTNGGAEPPPPDEDRALAELSPQAGRLADGHICAQCHRDPPDGKERPVAYGDETIWLHAECERFFIQGKM